MIHSKADIPVYSLEVLCFTFCGEGKRTDDRQRREVAGEVHGPLRLLFPGWGNVCC